MRCSGFAFLHYLYFGVLTCTGLYANISVEKLCESEDGYMADYSKEFERMQLKLLSDFSKALIHKAPFSEICEDDINGLFGSLLSLFSQYLRNIPNACNFSFAQSQPAYQMLLDLNDKI